MFCAGSLRLAAAGDVAHALLWPQRPTCVDRGGCTNLGACAPLCVVQQPAYRSTKIAHVVLSVDADSLRKRRCASAAIATTAPSYAPSCAGCGPRAPEEEGAAAQVLGVLGHPPLDHFSGLLDAVALTLACALPLGLRKLRPVVVTSETRVELATGRGGRASAMAASPQS
eukprot:CAMPEP_0176336762 /NCGR_PEP_ID=MMETSP0121_2-20121125/79285_1 /TAXON_ID=160619 /ORGANISM="Kryptoperidinium foliaceum, Strain CCMP 1326" /LENGTH=169 /DNA_ID=CAMNT_0017679753 /DNA_START=304 /DNA_END=811 /DNA_ORIENTATION=+